MSKKATEKAARKSTPIDDAPASVSELEAGTGSERVTTRNVVIYGPAKSRKTGSCKEFPRGRTKWLVSDPNCFSRDTEFITFRGVASFEHFEDGDKVVVRTHTGKWRDAHVKKYGMERLTQLVLGRGPNKQVIHATANHRWLLENGTVKMTAQLEEGDKLMRPPTPLRDWSYLDAPLAEKKAWLSGFVWGDGSTQFAHGKETGSRVRLCGEKQQFEKRISDLGFNVTRPDSAEGDPCFQLPGLFKRLPHQDASIEELTAFVRGYLDADGTHNMRGDSVNPFTGIQATGEESINFIRNKFPVVGAYISSERDCSDEVTNFGPRSDVTARFHIVMGFSSSPVAPYIVREVSLSERVETVWCLEVEKDQSFVMPSGIVTGNCIPTLRALKRLPHPSDIYQVTSLGAAVEFLEKVLALATEKGKGALGIDTLIIDSDTQFSDWHQAAVAADTNQRFMGDDEKNNGWQQFNAQFGRYLDLKALISSYIHVISICHTKPGAKPGKTTFAGLNLPPQMAGKQERLANWVLFKSFTEVNETDIGEVPNECLITMGPDNKKRYFDSSIWLKPIEGWFASANLENVELAELDRVGGDLYALFKEEGLLE